jgi:hypothetical protein
MFDLDRDLEYALGQYKWANKFGYLRYVHGFAVMVGWADHWFSRERILMELLVLRISKEPGFNVSYIPGFLEQLGREWGATKVISGDSTYGHMDKHYLAGGYRPLGTQYIRNI